MACPPTCHLPVGIGEVAETDLKKETGRICIKPLKSTGTLRRPVISMAIGNGRRKSVFSVQLLLVMIVGTPVACGTQITLQIRLAKPKEIQVYHQHIFLLKFRHAKSGHTRQQVRLCQQHYIEISRNSDLAGIKLKCSSERAAETV